MRIVIQLILALSMFSSCGGQSKSELKNAPVKGKLKNAEVSTILFQKLTAGAQQTLDTISVSKNGDFAVTKPIDEIGFYRLYLDDQNFIILVLDSTSRLELTADVKDFSKSYEVKGSQESSALQSLFAVMRKHDKTRDSLQAVLQAKVNDPNLEQIRVQLTTEYEQNEKDRQLFLKKYAEENSGSVSSLIAISSLRYEDHPQVFKKIHDDLSAKYPGSPVVEPYLQAYREMTRMGAGELAPDITMNTPEGTPLSLSDLRGKYVLIDFWASWCRPCRMENPNVVKVYEKYKDKGFEILGVSLDKDREQWLKAIQDDNLTWKHISDLAFWSSPVVKTYGVSGIPFTVLVDPEGKIIAKGLRAESLETTLSGLLK